MVDLSSKIKFKFRIKTNLDKTMLKKQPEGKILHDIYGDFQIFIDNALYFDEQEFLLLEFGILLKKWVARIKTGEANCFIYNSIEHDSPILEFRYLQESWEIFSEWRTSDGRIYISSNNLLSSSEEFLEQLEEDLSGKYDITLSSGILL